MVLIATARQVSPPPTSLLSNPLGEGKMLSVREWWWGLDTGRNRHKQKGGQKNIQKMWSEKKGGFPEGLGVDTGGVGQGCPVSREDSA